MTFGRLALAVTLLCVSALQAEAQGGPGVFIVGPQAQLKFCSDIANPVANLSWCAAGRTPYNWFVWDGANWIPITASSVTPWI